MTKTYSHTALRLLLALLLTSWAGLLAAQDSDSREVVNAQMMGFGHINTLDTYLSPEKYRGSELRYISQTVRINPGHHYSTQLTHYGSVAFTEDRSGDGSQMSGLYTFSLARHRDWWLGDDRWLLQAGLNGDLNLGFIYDGRNSNNPAQARLSLQIGPSVSALCKFRLGKKELVARYQVSAPLAGIRFSPNYGQSYYEIFSLGNYDHNVVFTNIVNDPSVRQLFTIDFPLLGATWRLGYLGDVQQAKANGLKQHFYTHALLVGFVKHFNITDIKP